MREYHSPKDYQDAAKSPETSLEELSLLAMSDYNFVRLAVVRNANVTSSMLRSALPDTLDDFNSQQIASEIARSPKAPRDTLKMIAEGIIPFLTNGRGDSMAPDAALNLCNNSAVPLEFVRIFLESEEVAIGIRKKIATNTSRREVLEILLSDKSEAVQKRAANKLKTLK